MPPVATRKQVPPRSDGVLGEWRDGAFHFDTLDAEHRWQVEAYRSGVHAENWQRGRALDDKTRDVVLSGLGGATAPVYRGPDGKYRFANAQTIESADIRALRAKSFQGVKLQDLKGPEMPGEDVIARRFAAGRVANDNAPAAAISTAAPVAPQPKKSVGRFAAMAEAQKDASHPSPQEALRAIDDGIRLFADGATISYADNAAAAANALFGAGSFAEDYEKNLSEEKARTAAARSRTGTVGAFVEAAPGMIPGYGDALSLVGDTKRYIEHPETATIGNILGSVVTALPGTPNVLSATRKIGNAAEDVAKLEAKTGQRLDGLPDARIAEDASKLDVPRPEKIHIDVNDPISVDSYFRRPLAGNEGESGHILSRHIGKTDAELKQRFQSERNVMRSSTFPDDVTAERVVHAGLQQNRQKVLDWLKDPNRTKFLTVRYSGQQAIGKTVTRSGAVSMQKDATIVLMFDKQGGFHYHTAFPGK